MSLYDAFTHEFLSADTERRAVANAEAARRLAERAGDAAPPARRPRPPRWALRRALLPQPRGYRMAR
ncbi:hypothetical protein [Georgenia thermotolerans]|uniref:Uncharacterized protein n=1 Tax=Georgenia thermotolerans TaxID=527326 RepID=A0A7J5UTD3_9MICO|nr:hypothetical protein [Georgenia thermotolerans]KAE8765539.1 hypothetical protein GB883_03180 [Georgenia thermotolerans]